MNMLSHGNRKNRDIKNKTESHMNFCPIILLVGSGPTIDLTGSGESRV